MSDEAKGKLRLEIAHVLFIDIVGYSKLLISEQSELLEHLKEMVRGSEEVRAADADGKLIRLATGDGMALVFRNSPEAPVQCALELARADKAHPELRLRMGIHSGPINEITDVNERANVTGAGINMAQRIMDCGEAGHILLSQHVADDLEQYGQWRPLLHDLGECEVKHGVRLHVVNLYNDEVGNPAVPEKFAATKPNLETMSVPSGKSAAIPWRPLVIAATVVAFGAAASFWWHRTSVGASGARSVPAAQSPLPSVPEKSIAVLPFENLSSDKENAYFTDGVQDEILTNLAKVADLKVISRTSVMQYKSSGARNLRKIGEELGVAHLLEGSVQRASGKVRVDAQLIDARTDAHQWAENYDRPLDDVFAIQSEIAKAIADQLRVRISPSEAAAMAKPLTNDLAANALYVEAKQLGTASSDTNSKERLLQSVRLLEQAVALDPKFVVAYCWLARVHLDLYFGGLDHTPARRDMADAAIQAAAHIEPDNGEVHLERARYVYNVFRDYDRARSELEIARAKLPNDADVFILGGALDRRQARWTESVNNWERAVELDPRNANLLENASYTLTGLNRYQEAAALLARAVNVAPPNYYGRMILRLQSVLQFADTKPLRHEIDEIVAEDPRATTIIAHTAFECAMWERDRAAVRRALAAIRPEGISTGANFTFPRQWYVGLAARAFGDAEAARSAFTAARDIEEKLVQEQPDYAAAWSLLGMIDAALGRKDDAVREGRRACELLPLSKDSWIGPAYVADLAVIYAWTGERDLALEQLQSMAGAKGSFGLHYGILKLDPRWDPLRGDPRFDKIVASLAPKE